MKKNDLKKVNMLIEHYTKKENRYIQLSIKYTKEARLANLTIKELKRAGKKLSKGGKR